MRELAPHVQNYMMSGFNGLDVHLPATLNVQLVIYLRGAVFFPDAGAYIQRMPTAFVAGPVLAPRMFQVEPGSLFIAATFRRSGFFSCFGIPAHVLRGQIVPLDAILASGTLDALLEQLHSGPPVRQFRALEAFLLQQLRLGRGHAGLPAFSLEHLLSPTTRLAETLDISTRQLERRFLVHYGMPLRDYRRLARFSTALGAILQSTSHRPNLSEIAQNALYTDQSHFTRDFREFVGNTPGRYVRERGEKNSIYQLWQLSPDELTAFMP